MRIFIMSDIHGHYKEFIRLLQYVNFSSKDRLVILGDIIDRGPNSFEVFKYIKDRPNIKLIRGNHELMFLDYQRESNISLGDNGYAASWYLNGARATIDSFMSNVDKLNFNPLVELEYYLIDSKYYLLHNDYIMVHAGYAFDRLDINNDDIAILLNTADDTNLVWGRDFWKSVFVDNKKVVPNRKTLICGHTGIHKQFTGTIPYNLDVPKLIYRKFNNGSSVIDLDLSTIVTGMMGLFELSTREFIYIGMDKNIHRSILD